MAALLSAGLMLLTTLPYGVAWLSAGDTWEFGGFLFGVDDGNSYLAKMRMGAEGAWLYTNRYTSEPHDGALLFLPYLMLGKVTAIFANPGDYETPTALAVTYHAARVLFGWALLLMSYRFAAVFLPTAALRRLALTLMALGGGLGWLLALIGQTDWLGSLPVDFIVPEGYSFLILLGLPHLALARMTILGGFLLLFRSWKPQNGTHSWVGWSLAAGLCWVVTGLCVPFYVPVIYVIVAGTGVAAWLRWRQLPSTPLKATVLAACVPIPLLAYTAAVFLTNDVLRRWSSQNLLPSPHPAHYILGYVVLALPAVIGARWVWRRGSDVAGLPSLLLVAWAVVAPVAVYLPINVQRRLAEGVIVPLSILAVEGLRLAFGRRAAWRRARALALALALPTSILLWIGALYTALTPARPVFRPQTELAAMDHINRSLPPDGVILSLMETGNYLPVRSELIAYVGHGPETIDSGRKALLAETFFAGELPGVERNSLLAQVDYVYFGPLEQAAAGTAEPAWAAELRRLDILHDDGPVQLFEVPRD